jgi:chorismate synthase
VARKLLRVAGIEVMGLVREMGGVVAESPVTEGEAVRRHPWGCSEEDAARMEKEVLKARGAGDSCGGIVEVRARGVPAGLGEPVFDKLDARLGAALLSIGAVKGVEIGGGFALARMRGSESNDGMLPPDRFASNRAGGILGGISNGEEIVVRAAIKPTPSIAVPQLTVDSDGQARELRLEGRHDPCLVPRALVVAEAMVCLVLADALLLHRARQGFSG